MEPGDLIFLAEHLKPPMVQQIQVSSGLIGQFQECILAAPPLLLPANITSVNIWNTRHANADEIFQPLEANALVIYIYIYK